MTLNEFIFDTLEPLNAFYIDYSHTTKQLTPVLYKQLYNKTIDKYYLDIKDNNAVIIIKLQDF